MSHLKTMLATFLVCVVIFGAYLLMAVLDQLPDHSDEYPQSDQIEQSFKRKALEAELNRKGRDACGNTQHEWLGGDAFKCTPRRGPRKPYVVHATNP